MYMLHNLAELSKFNKIGHSKTTTSSSLLQELLFIVDMVDWFSFTIKLCQKFMGLQKLLLNVLLI